MKVGPWKISFREAPLTASMLAALVPPEINADVRIVDESVDTIPFHKTFDLVAISSITGTAPRAYAIADHFRAQGVTVVLGGVHITLLPDEAAQHADAIVIGFAETTWPQLLRDWVNGQLKPRYQSDDPGQVAHLPVPRRDLQKGWRYMVPYTVFATRGCKGTCDFCTVPAVNYGWHMRPIAEVIAEIRQIPSRRLAFSDVNLTEDPDYAKAFLRALIPLKKQWGGLASTRIGEDDELLDLLHQSGCQFLLFGFESMNNQSLRSIHKGFNKVEEYQKLIHKLHQRRIIILGCFIFGFDEDDPSVFARTVEMIDHLKIDIPRYAIYTPYPRTQAFERLEAERRMLHYQWQYYDTQHVVFQPKQMTPQQLDDGFRWAFQRTYTLRSMLKRTWGPGRNFLVAFVGNLAYTLYIKRLKADQQRFPGPV